MNENSKNKTKNLHIADTGITKIPLKVISFLYTNNNYYSYYYFINHICDSYLLFDKTQVILFQSQSSNVILTIKICVHKREQYSTKIAKPF